jgi:hypothetical protein
MCFPRLKNIKSLTSKNSGTLIVKIYTAPRKIDRAFNIINFRQKVFPKTAAFLANLKDNIQYVLIL